MADGIVNVPHLENRTVTLLDGFSLVSWGFISAIQLGRLIYIQGSGIMSSSAVTTLTEMATVNGITLAATTNGIVQFGDKVTSIQAWQGGTNKVRISAGVPANTNFSFFIVGFCN